MRLIDVTQVFIELGSVMWIVQQVLLFHNFQIHFTQRLMFLCLYRDMKLFKKFNFFCANLLPFRKASTKRKTKKPHQTRQIYLVVPDDK